jgi:ATP-binding cassette subfamily B protein
LVAIVTVLAYTGLYALFLGVWAIAGDAAIHKGFTDRTRLIGLTFLAGLLGLQVLATYLTGTIVRDMGLRLKRRMMKGILGLQSEAVRSAGLGTFLGITFEADVLQNVTMNGIYGGLLGVFELMAAIFVFTTVHSAGLGEVLLAAGFLLVILGYAYVRSLEAWTDERLQITGELTERFLGHRTRLIQSRSIAQEDFEHATHLSHYERTAERLDRLYVALATFVPQGWLAVATAVFFLLRSPVSATSRAASIGGILLGWQALSGLGLTITQMAQGIVAWKRLKPLLLPSSVLNARRPEALNHTKPPARAEQAEPLHAGQPREAGVLRATSIRFSHEAHREPVWDGISLAVRSGDRLVIEGRSGSGKSTLLAVLAGIRQPTAGRVFLTSPPRDDLSAQMGQRQVVLVPQAHENHVFGSTFAFNLLLGVPWPPRDGDVARAYRVITDLGLGDLLAKMPGGLGQVLGETGWQLSHGERSLLWLARALIQNPEFLLLDEVLGTLDPESRLRVLQVLDRYPGAVVLASHE